MFLELGAQFGICHRRLFLAVLEHFLLRGQHFGQLALHENDFVVMARRQVFEQLEMILTTLPPGLGQPVRLALAQLLDRLELEVAVRVIVIGRPQGVADHFQAAFGEHFHHH